MAKYESLADIQQEDQARRAKAHRFDTLRSEWSNNARQVEKLDAQAASLRKQMLSLERIIEEANKLPNDVVHDGMGVSGGCAIPNGYTRPMVVAIASSALLRVKSKDEERCKAIDAARKRRDTAKAALNEEFPE
jgi:hypothetical protein